MVKTVRFTVTFRSVHDVDMEDDDVAKLSEVPSVERFVEGALTVPHEVTLLRVEKHEVVG